MKNMGLIQKRLFVLQLSYSIMVELVEGGFVVDDDNAERAAKHLASVFGKGLDLPDFTFDFHVTDKYDSKKYIA